MSELELEELGVGFVTTCQACRHGPMVEMILFLHFRSSQLYYKLKLCYHIAVRILGWGEGSQGISILQSSPDDSIGQPRLSRTALPILKKLSLGRLGGSVG